MNGIQTNGDPGGRVRPPVIFGASLSLVRVYAPDELAGLAHQLRHVSPHQPAVDVAGGGRAVLLAHRDPDVTASAAVAIAQRETAWLLWVDANELVSTELSFPQRAMSTVMRFAARLGHTVVYVHDFDAVAHPTALHPSHYARRATHDVVSAARSAPVHRSDVTVLIGASPEVADRDSISGRFDVAVRLRPGDPTDDWEVSLTDVA